MKKVLILGGDFAGLSTALRLQKAGWQGYEILEKDSWIGGLTQSESVQGLTFHYTRHVLHFTAQSNTKPLALSFSQA